MDVAPWCYKWVSGWIGYPQVGVDIEHVSLPIKVRSSFMVFAHIKIFCAKVKHWRSWVYNKSSSQFQQGAICSYASSSTLYLRHWVSCSFKLV